MPTSCTTSVTFASRPLRDGHKKGSKNTLYGVPRFAINIRTTANDCYNPLPQVVGGMLGANNELERRLEQVLNSRGVSLYGLSETVG